MTDRVVQGILKGAIAEAKHSIYGRDEPCPRDLETKCPKLSKGSPTYRTSAGVAAMDFDAVVDIEAVSVLGSGFVVTPNSTIPSPGVEDIPEIPAGTAVGTFIPREEDPTVITYRIAGSGFFTDCRYIVTAATNVALQKYVITGPEPIYTVGEDEFVGPAPGFARIPLPDPDARLVRANRVFVRVYNVNGNGSSILYEAVIIGIDATANVAVLRIDETLIFNRDKPCLDKATYIKWGKSKKYPTGSDVYTIGNAEQSGRKFFGGYVTDNCNVDVRFKYYLSLDTSIPFFDGLIGAPLIDSNGNAVGVLTGRTSNINYDQISLHNDINGAPLINTEVTTSVALNDYGLNQTYQAIDSTGGVLDTYVTIPGDISRVKGAQQAIRGTCFGVSQSDASRVIREFIKTDMGKCSKKIDRQTDEAGDFLLSRKGWFNIHVELVTTNTWLNHNLIVNSGISGGSGPGFDASDIPSFNVRVPYCSEMAGYFVRCINANSPLATIDPRTGLPLLSPGDLITSLACKKVGVDCSGFYSTLWKFKPGDTVQIVFMKHVENYARTYCAELRLEEVFYDWPLEGFTNNEFGQFLNQNIAPGSGLVGYQTPIGLGYDPSPLCAGPFVFTLENAWVSNAVGLPNDLVTPLPNGASA